MNTQTTVIFQSGQSVPTTGMYEIVGTNRKTKTGEFTLRLLTCGEMFPFLEGRSVAWHELDSEASHVLAPTMADIHAPNQN